MRSRLPLLLALVVVAGCAAPAAHYPQDPEQLEAASLRLSDLPEGFAVLDTSLTSPPSGTRLATSFYHPAGGGPDFIVGEVAVFDSDEGAGAYLAKYFLEIDESQDPQDLGWSGRRAAMVEAEAGDGQVVTAGAVLHQNAVATVMVVDGGGGDASTMLALLELADVRLATIG